MTVIGINVVGLMMLLRIKALYNRKKVVVWSVAALLTLEFGVNAWLLFYGTPVLHIGPRSPCTMVFEQKMTKIAAASAWLPLLYDTVVMALTTYKTFQTRSVPGYFHSPILQTVLAGGMIYYSVIFSIALILAIMIAIAPPSIQNISAQLELLMTVAMMSRITIDLKKRAEDHIHYDLSGRPVVVDEDGPYCYQLSRIRFRDMITGGKRMPKNIRVPRESTRKQNLGDSGTPPNAGMILIIRGATVEETLKQTRNPDDG